MVFRPQKLVERGGESHRLGHALLIQVEVLFRLWGQVKNGTLRRVDFQVKVQPIRVQVHELLQAGTTIPHAQTRHLCENLLKLEGALWTFIFVDGVEPTNPKGWSSDHNAAERELRPAVIIRKTNGCNRSPAGAEAHAIITSVLRTCEKHGRDFVAVVKGIACQVGRRALDVVSDPPARTAVIGARPP
jgi:transposase